MYRICHLFFNPFSTDYMAYWKNVNGSPDIINKEAKEVEDNDSVNEYVNCCRFHKRLGFPRNYPIFQHRHING